MAESPLSAKELNDQLLYTCYAVFKAVERLPADRGGLTAEAQGLLDAALDKDVYTRGTYDLGAYKAEADLLVWWTCPDVDLLQDVYARFRTTELGRHLVPVWSSIGLHRPAEFNRSHIPAYVKREDPRKYVCVYPFNRSLEWYLLPDFERRGMLAEHGQMGRDFEDVRASTVAAFGLGDYEWLLAFEADEVHRIVDCLRHLRGSRARVHTKLETPFWTGARKPLAEIVTALP
ncbi:MAG TPA: hydrogen peroxide-dependent heme synthase [Mycobacteriales bacterium]|nr:hydrogen peroxide-dependent heme synthase [Mycobacteriales bacterium]